MDRSVEECRVDVHDSLLADKPYFKSVFDRLNVFFLFARILECENGLSTYLLFFHSIHCIHCFANIFNYIISESLKYRNTLKKTLLLHISSHGFYRYEIDQAWKLKEMPQQISLKTTKASLRMQHKPMFNFQRFIQPCSSHVHILYIHDFKLIENIFILNPFIYIRYIL